MRGMEEEGGGGGEDELVALVRLPLGSRPEVQMLGGLTFRHVPNLILGTQARRRCQQPLAYLLSSTSRVEGCEDR